MRLKCALPESDCTHVMSASARKRGEGSVFLTSLILLVSMAFLGGLLVRLVDLESEATLTRVDRTQALYLAHAGVALAVHELHRERYGEVLEGEPQDGNVPTAGGSRMLAGGHLWARFDAEAQTLFGTGRVGEVERTVVVRLGVTP